MSALYDPQDKITDVAVSVDFDTAGDNVLLTPGKSVLVKRLILVCTEVSAGTSVATIKVRNVDDTSSTTIGTFSIVAGIALNAVRYVNFIEPATTGSAGADNTSYAPTLVFSTATKAGHIRVNPGQEFEVTSDGAGTAGIFNVYVEYADEGFNEKASYAGSEIAFTAS